MTLFTAHTDFPVGHALSNTDLNSRFTELATILNGGIVDENVSTLSASKIGGTAALLTGSTQTFTIANIFSALVTMGRLVGKRLTFADGDTSPDISGDALIYLTANTGPTTIDEFDGGQEGQIIIVIAGDGNTTIDQNLVPSGGIRTGNGVMKTLAAGEVHAFVGFDNGGTLNFNEMFRSVP